MNYIRAIVQFNTKCTFNLLATHLSLVFKVTRKTPLPTRLRLLVACRRTCCRIACSSSLLSVYCLCATSTSLKYIQSNSIAVTYAESSSSGAISIPQMKFKTVIVDVSVVQLPKVSAETGKQQTIENTVTDLPLFRDIGMKNRCYKTRLGGKSWVVRVHVNVN